MGSETTIIINTGSSNDDDNKSTKKKYKKKKKRARIENDGLDSPIKKSDYNFGAYGKRMTQ